MGKKTENAELEVVNAEVITTPVAVTPLSLIAKGMESGLAIEEMSKLLDLQMRWDENESKKAFYEAFAAFKTETIIILKDKEVGYKNKDGTFTGYKHASLGGVVLAITPVLAAHGFSHRWDMSQVEGTITVTCILSHCKGHSTEVSFSGEKDDSGKKNKIQQVASTVTYLQRYTLLLSTGHSPTDASDDDGNGSEKPVIEYITEHQAEELAVTIENNDINAKGFLNCFKIKAIGDLPADKFKAAGEMLENIRKGNK